MEINQLKKACFPLPMRYEKPEKRFVMRDGARHAMALRARGVDATKLLIGDPAVDRPESPVLRVARWEQWCDPGWWREQAFDLVVMYGRPVEAIRAVREGSPGTWLGLQMDSGYGVQVSWLPSPLAMLRRYPFYRWVREYSWLRAVAHSVGNVLKNTGPGAIRRQKELFGLLDEIRYENPFAIEQTARWCRRHGVPELADKLVLAPHPVLPSMRMDPSVKRVPESMISVADWTVKAKDADLLVRTLARVLRERPGATVTMIGKGSGRVRERILDFRGPGVEGLTARNAENTKRAWGGEAHAKGAKNAKGANDVTEPLERILDFRFGILDCLGWRNLPQGTQRTQRGPGVEGLTQRARRTPRVRMT